MRSWRLRAQRVAGMQMRPGFASLFPRLQRRLRREQCKALNYGAFRELCAQAPLSLSVFVILVKDPIRLSTETETPADSGQGVVSLLVPLQV